MLVKVTATAAQKAAQQIEAMKSDKLIELLKSASFAELDKYVDSTVTNMDTAKDLLKRMLAVMAFLVHKE